MPPSQIPHFRENLMKIGTSLTQKSRNRAGAGPSESTPAAQQCVWLDSSSESLCDLRFPGHLLDIARTRVAKRQEKATGVSPPILRPFNSSQKDLSVAWSKVQS
ncbi:hypothetical protein FRC14_008162 [Serendipita sp. 396]|nr:hypothetical protein FRC14_008162 [Serendipita sp. 396]